MKCAPAIALGCAVVLMSAAAYGQEEGAIPEDVLKDLQYNIGDWTTKVTFGEQVIDGTWSGKWSAEGKCLVVSMSGAMLDKDGKGEQVKTHGTGVIGWDATTECIKEVAFWSDGNTYDARYKKTSDTTWEGEAKGTVGGKKYTEKVSITRNDDKEFVWKAFDYVLGGEKQPDIIATITKVWTAKQDHEKLEEAFGWLVGKWGIDGTDDERGGWAMTFTFNWDILGTVLDWRNDYVTEKTKWAGETRHYWDPVDEKIKNVSFTGFGGGPRHGELKECGKNNIVWSSNVVRKDGSIGKTEFHFSLQDDGKLLFLHFGILDDGTRKESFRFELTKK